MNSKLKPCPLCENTDINAVDLLTFGDMHLIECFDCGCRVDGETLLEAINFWNTRPDTVPLSVLEEVLRGECFDWHFKDLMGRIKKKAGL